MSGFSWPRPEVVFRIVTAVAVLSVSGLGVLPLPHAEADPPTVVPTANTPAKNHPLDQPLAMLAQAKKYHQEVRDYTCTLVKQERVNGRLQEENYIDMRMRTYPFSVYMRWLGPRAMAGQEVCFVLGRNNNMMRVHAKGLLKGAIGWVSVDPRDPRVFQHSRHTIYEAGIGNLIEQTSKHWERARQGNKTQVKIAEYDFNNRRCYRVEAIHTERDPQNYSHRCVLFLDKQTYLPLRVENYDWPRQGGSPDGDLMESFSFVNLRTNVSLPEETFNR